MTFQVGDRVIHWVHGLGEIIQEDEKRLDGHSLRYYVVKINNMMIWVPVSMPNEINLRYPTPPAEFDSLFSVLSSPAEPLSDDRMVRKTQLVDQLRDGMLTSYCRVVRDLTYRGRTSKLNDYDRAVMERAQKFLLSEWAYSLSVSVPEANEHMNELLSQQTTSIG